MLGKLSDGQIESLLQSQLVGRIGCYNGNKVYVIPVTYVYHKDFIYIHSKEGTKVQMMRKNPNVCFQVDAIDNMANWRSVIVWGKYEELKTEREQKTGMKLLTDRLTPFKTSETVHHRENLQAPKVIEKALRPVVYRIRIVEKTGRFEKT